MAAPPLGVTGATGKLGRRIAHRLADAGVDQRLVVRTPARAPSLPRATVAQATYADHDAVRRALTGLDVVLMVSAAESDDRVAEHRAFVDAALEAGGRHLVYTSFLRAAAHPTLLLAPDPPPPAQHIAPSRLSRALLRGNPYPH